MLVMHSWRGESAERRGCVSRIIKNNSCRKGGEKRKMGEGSKGRTSVFVCWVIKFATCVVWKTVTITVHSEKNMWNSIQRKKSFVIHELSLFFIFAFTCKKPVIKLNPKSTIFKEFTKNKTELKFQMSHEKRDWKRKKKRKRFLDIDT